MRFFRKWKKRRHGEKQLRGLVSCPAVSGHWREVWGEKSQCNRLMDFSDRHEPWPDQGWGLSVLLLLLVQVYRHLRFLDRCATEWKWELSSVLIPRVCYCSGNLEFLELGVMQFHFGGAWLPALQKALHVTQILRGFMFPHSQPGLIVALAGPSPST